MRPLRNPDTVSRDLGDGEVMILVAGQAAEQALVLNPIGAAVWHLADGGRDVDAIASLIADHYPDADIEQVREDVAELVHHLLEKGALLAVNRTP